MSIRWFLIYIALFSFPLFSLEALSEALIAQITPDILSRYKEVNRQFVRELCPSGTEELYASKLSIFNGDGHFIPLLPDGSLDSETIIQHIPIIIEKIAWLDKNLAFLGGSYDELREFHEINSKIDGIARQVEQALDFKKDFFESTDGVLKNDLQQKSATLIKEIRENFEVLLTGAPFLMPFKYPVDHLSMRGEYDRFKFREDVLGNRFSNRVFFARRIF